MSVLRAKTWVFHPTIEKLEAETAGRDFTSDTDSYSAWRYRSFRSRDIEFIDQYDPKKSIIIYYDGRTFLVDEPHKKLNDRWSKIVQEEPQYDEDDEEVDGGDEEEEN